MSTNPIALAKQRIAEKRAAKAMNDTKIATLRSENDKADLAIAAWEEVLRDLMSVMPHAGLSHNGATAVVAALSNDTTAETLDRRRGPKGMWKLIMPRMIAEYHSRNFTVADLENVGRSVIGMPVNSNTARSQIANYLRSEFLDRVGPGRYRFTQAGMDVFASLLNTPDAMEHSERETPAVDDVQTAGDSPGNVDSVSPKASSEGTATGESDPR